MCVLASIPRSLRPPCAVRPWVRTRKMPNPRCATHTSRSLGSVTIAASVRTSRTNAVVLILSCSSSATNASTRSPRSLTSSSAGRGVRTSGPLPSRAPSNAAPREPDPTEAGARAGRDAPLPQGLRRRRRLRPARAHRRPGLRRDLLRRVYAVDPLVCPRCAHSMRIVGFITQPEALKRILDHLRRPQARPRPPPRPPAVSVALSVGLSPRTG